jgi:NitT/TauT family transport system permease protein
MDTTGLFAGILVVMLVGSLVERGVLGALERVTVHRWGMAQ